QLFNLSSGEDVINKTTMNDIFKDQVSEMIEFGIKLPESVSIVSIKSVGAPYTYSLSVQGFPIGDYVGTTSYCNVIADGSVYGLPAANNMFTDAYSLEYAPNGEKYVVFYNDTDFALGYADANRLIMVSYWAYYQFKEGFDYRIFENPEDPFETLIVWDYSFKGVTDYKMHPDFASGSSFSLDFSALEWSEIDDNYVKEITDKFVFQDRIKSNLTVKYSGQAKEEFSVLNVVPENQWAGENQFDFNFVCVSIWDGQDIRTLRKFKTLVFDGLITQSNKVDYYYTIDFSVIPELSNFPGGYQLFSNSYAYIEVEFDSTQLKYLLSATPFNYDYIDRNLEDYQVKIKVNGVEYVSNEEASNDLLDFHDFVLKIESNYIYFRERNSSQDGYVAPGSEISVNYRYKVQPGLLERKSFTMVINDWSNVFNTLLSDGELYKSSDSTITYRERYRKLSGSSIIAPFEYSLSVNDAYSLYLSYRLSRRDFYEEKFTIKYSNTINYNGSYAYEFDYKPFNIDKYAAEFLDDDGEPALSVYYYDKKGRMQFLDGNYYDLDLNNHRIILKPEIYGGVDLNPITDRSINKDIRDFYVSFVPSGSDAEFDSYRFTYDPNGKLKNTLSVNYWSVAGGSRAGVVPNFNAYYFANDKESSYNNMVGHASQILAFVENGNSLMFDIEGELSAYDNGELLEGIRSGEYLALYIDANIRNCESLEKLLIKLYNSSGVFSTQDITPEELLMYDFNVKIDLPSKTNTLKSVEIVPIFRESALYSADNTVGVPNFEFEEWDEEATFFDSDGNKFMKVPLDNELKTDTSLNLAYIFNEDFESLSLPDGVDFGWDTVEDEFGVVKSYALLVPNTFKDPKNNSKTISFKEGDSFVIRYNSPVEKAISIGIGTMYFQKKPYGYKSDLPIAEVLLVNAENSSDYSEYTRDYFARLPLRLTPFDTEISNTFKDVKISLNLSEFTDFAIDGEIAFSDIIVSVPYPNYELSLDQFMIQKEGRGTSLEFEEINENVWQFSEKETYTSSNSPANDTYYFKPPANIFGGQISWPDYAKIYDEHYNYYRAGTEGDENQLLWANDTFYWNPSFDRFQEYWGAQIELPMTADPRTELYFEYCTQDSWKTPISLDYGNIDFSSLEVIFDLEHFLTPKYEKWYDITVENANYDYKIVQYYEESFSVYSAANKYTYEFELEYDLRDDFKNLSLYSVVGLTPTFEDCVIRDDGVNYEINLDLINKSITIIDKNPEDGSLSKFDLITVIFNFSNGPISSRSEIILSDEFREKYLSDAESTFYSYLSISFQYAVMEGDILFYEDYETITTEMTSFESIDYTRNDVLGSNFKIPGYDSELFINFRLYYDDSNVIYVADIDNDGEKDYKQIIDFNKDGKVDVIKYGINDPENPEEIIWHTIIQQFETSEIYVNKSSSEEKWTKWFDIKDAEFASYSYALGDVFDLSGVKLKNINDFFNIFGTIIENFAAIFIPDVDFWARKSIQTQSTEKRSVNYGYYGVKIDSDRDGYPDKSVQYEKTDVVAEYTAINREKVLLAGKRQTILTKIDDFISRNMESFFEGTPEDKVFNNKLTEDKLDNKRGTGYLKSSYRKFTKTSTVSYVKEYCSEQITISDYSEGRIEEQRIYKDDFDSGERLADEGTYPVRNLITRALQDVPSVPELSKTDPSDGSWDAETWGVDDVPVKFDALTKISMGKRQTENAFERTIKLVIPNRFSVYHDFYKSSKENALGSTEIEVSGVFITPPGGQVYFSSDKELFKKVKSKTKGHYFYYDSDDNGFYETVYVLAPSSDGEKYDVIAIGYSYDGDHDFAPYDNLNYKVESETTFDQIKKETLKFDRWSYHFGDLEEMELLFPEDFDGYQARDSIFEVWKLIEKSTQNKRYPLLFDEVRRRTYRNIMNVYREQMW
ncbi:MAG: hypothetical protein ACTSQ8_22060, partial [Candidatus Helarchaeota archaeon]